MVVVADLVAKFRADVTDAQRGLTDTRQQLQQVGQEARATGDQLDALSKKFAASQGGTAAGWREILDRTNLSASAAAKQLGDTQRAASAAADTGTKLATSLEQTQRSGKGLSDVLGLSEGGLVRASGALIGVGLGLNIAAGVAGKLHDVIEGIVTSQLDWERSLKTISGTYGDLGPKIAATAQAQANLPGVLGTAQEFASARLSATDLNLRYGINAGTIGQLITTGGRVAYATGLTDQQDRTKLQQEILDAVRTGASLPSQYGVFTDEEAVARRLGTPGAQSLQTYTPQQLMAARAAIVAEGLSQFSDRAEANQRAALDATTAAEKALEQSKTNAQATIESGGLYDQIFPLGIIPGTSTKYDSAPPTPPNAAALQTYVDNQEQLVQATQLETQALANSKQVQEDAQKTLARLKDSAEAAGSRLASFSGSLEDVTSIGHGDLLAQVQATAAQMGRSTAPTFALTQREIEFRGGDQAAQDAWQNFRATFGQSQVLDAVQKNLERFAGGAGSDDQRVAAQAALADLARRKPAYTALGEAQKASSLAQLEVDERQSDLAEIQLRQQQRSLDVDRETIDAKRNVLQITQQNVDATEHLLRAQQSAQAPQNALQDLSYQQQRTALLAQTRQARLILGQDVSELPSFNDLISTNVGLALAAPGVGLRALDASHAVDVAGRPAAAGGISAALAQLAIIRPDIALSLANLGDESGRIAAQGGLITAQGTANAADRATRAATVNLANVGMVVNVDGTIRLAPDAIAAAAQAAYDQVEQQLSEGLRTSSDADPPTSPGLPGVR